MSTTRRARVAAILPAPRPVLGPINALRQERGHCRSRLRQLVVAAGLSCWLVSGLPSWPAGAAEEPKSWQIALKIQLKTNHACDLDKILFSQDLKVGEHLGTEGRARCLDGREYDFTRARANQKFDIRLCRPTVC